MNGLTASAEQQHHDEPAAGKDVAEQQWAAQGLLDSLRQDITDNSVSVPQNQVQTYSYYLPSPCQILYLGEKQVLTL